MSDTLFLLKSNRIFKGVSDADLKNIAPIFEKKYYPRGAKICEEGEMSSSFYILLSGQVRAMLSESLQAVVSQTLLKKKGGSPTWGSVHSLGNKASHGCVRLSVENAKWLFQNCEAGTVVTVY